MLIYIDKIHGYGNRTKNKGVLSFKDKCYWIQMGIDGYRNDYSFEELKDRNNIK